jgi:TetR/AcrR family transcriptional regulator, repressor for uid operon
MRTVDPELQNRRRSEIVSAAEQCFLKRGFHQTSMQNIASASGLSMGLLYRYFSNKEAIIDAVAQRDQEASLAAIADLPAKGDVITAWVSLLISASDLASAPGYAALASEILAEANRAPKILKMLQANEAALALAIADKLAEQEDHGVIDLSDNAELAAQSLLLLFDGLTMRKLMITSEIGRAIEQGLKQMVLSILVRGDG